MDDRTLVEILRGFRRLRRESVRLRMAIVTDDSPLSIRLGNADDPLVAVPKLSSYATPVVDDRVAVLIRGNDLLVLGTID